MKQPDSLDTGTQMDIARYRLQTAKEEFYLCRSCQRRNFF